MISGYWLEGNGNGLRSTRSENVRSEGSLSTGIILSDVLNKDDTSFFIQISREGNEDARPPI